MHFSKYTYWRLIAIFCCLFICACYGFCYFLCPTAVDKQLYFSLLIPLAAFMLYSIIHQMFFPLDLRLYIIWVFIFSCLGVSCGFTAYSLLTFYFAYFLGTETRFFLLHKRRKLIIYIICYLLCATLQIRLSHEVLLRSLYEFCFSISAVVGMYYINEFILKRIKQDIFFEKTKENIDDYLSEENFTARDKEMLKEVLAGCKYEEIAINHNLSLSSVKKRLGFLYKKLGVTCQIDFIIKFTGKDTENAEKQ